jgi:hypothetical protein
LGEVTNPTNPPIKVTAWQPSQASGYQTAVVETIAGTQNALSFTVGS